MSGCRVKQQQPQLTANDVSKVINKMTELMVHDVTNPPLAARFYAYTCLAGYEAAAENNHNLTQMQGKLKQYPYIKKPGYFSGYDYKLATIFAMLQTASKLQPSGKQLVEYEETLADSCRKVGFDDAVIDSSKSYAHFIAMKILTYAKADNYNRISNLPRYKTAGQAGTWVPTPPAFMMPVEPYFNTIRPFTLDSASQFKPVPPAPFSTDKNSLFFKYLKQNYQKGEANLSTEEKDIANFWDCNPFAVQNNGHMLIGLKKISPGAHWMAIAGIACRQANAGFDKAIKVHTVLAIGLLDGFICCWDEKYRSNRIRPETAVRRYMDPNWKPFLQTPPFPEYLSGHSVVSAVADVILSRYFGESFHYTDDTEVSYGVPPRKFSSFHQAAKEAAISRFFGGIHFMDGIDNGFKMGAQAGEHVLETVEKN